MKRIIIGLTIIVNIIVLAKVINLNINNKYSLKKTYVEGLTAPRGRILDINGNILVDNIGVKALIFNKLNLSNQYTLTLSQTLSEILDIKENVDNYNLKYYYYLLNKNKIDNLVPKNIMKKYEERKINSNELLKYKMNLINDQQLDKVDKKAAYIYYLLNKGYIYEDKIIKTNISEDEYNKINELNLKGLRTEMIWERIYPYNNTLRDIFGSVSSFNQGIPLELKDYYLNKGYSLNDRVGINNLEYIYDDYLKGRKAKFEISKGKLKMIKEEEKGKDIVLSIDIDLQQKIEKILEEEMIKAKKEFNTKYYDSSYMIVSNPNNGEIISLIGKKINQNNNFQDYSYYNAISSFTVGSAVKGASISVGYKYNIINEKTTVIDSCIRLYGQKPKCSWKSLGRINDINALKMSSNYFQYLIAIGLTNHKYHPGIKINANKEDFEKYRNVFSLYGLGIKTGIDLQNESIGQKGNVYSDDLLLNYSIGQYDTYTPLQLSQYINTIATGQRIELSLLKYIINNDGSIYYENRNKVLNQAPIDEKYLKRIRLGLKAVNDSGTGYSYTNHTFTSAGKTGTAESFLDSDADGNIDKATVSTSYIMYAPFEKPVFSIIIVSPNIKYKNKVSNYKYPINAKVMKRVSSLVYEQQAN